MTDLAFKDGILELTPGPVDVHGHPRVFDPIISRQTVQGEAHFGKSGLPLYTEAALKCGFTVISAMPNELIRFLPENSDSEDKNGILMPYPISNLENARAMERAISAESRLKMTYHLGLNPEHIIYGDDQLLNLERLNQDFIEAGAKASALKIYGDITTGGFNIPTKHIPNITQCWSSLYPDKPIIMHLENENVRDVLEAVYSVENGKHIKIHIAHVSSQEELEAVIWAKEKGMNVTCEVTPHHLFVDAEAGASVGGYGCMKPGLKNPDDLKFLWDNIRYIDVFASDCAPHTVEDKESTPPAFGVTNHTVMMQLLFGAFEEGRLTLNQIVSRTCINPREIFNIPRNDNTTAIFDLNRGFDKASDIEELVLPRYGQNIFLKLEEVLGTRFHLLGHLLKAKSGDSEVAVGDNGELQTSFNSSNDHLIRMRA